MPRLIRNRRLGSFGIGIVAGLVCSGAGGDDPPRPVAPVSVPLLAEFAIPGVEPRAADADAPLADDWPKATRPGVIEVKAYPGYRGAVARGKNATMESDNVLFYPLFVHIRTRNVEMTSPVVNTFDAAMVAKPGTTGNVEMEFVYRTPDLGPAGPGVGAVVVEDHPASSFVCLGAQGDLDPEKFRLGVAALRKWLDNNEGEWVAAGSPRRLGYHAPMVDKKTRWWEIQIPIKPATKPG